MVVIAFHQQFQQLHLQKIDGIKYVVYNFVQDGKTIVKLENWLDNNNNGNWAKIYEYTDAGGWGNQEHNVEEILTR